MAGDSWASAVVMDSSLFTNDSANVFLDFRINFTISGTILSPGCMSNAKIMMSAATVRQALTHNLSLSILSSTHTPCVFPPPMRMNVMPKDARYTHLNANTRIRLK